MLRLAPKSGSESCRAPAISSQQPSLPQAMRRTWRALTDPAKRPSQPRTPIPADLLESQAGSDVRLGPTSIAMALRDAKRGGAAGLSGMRAEHLKLLLQDLPALELLAYLARLTALQKAGGGVRGIATGDFIVGAGRAVLCNGAPAATAAPYSAAASAAWDWGRLRALPMNGANMLRQRQCRRSHNASPKHFEQCSLRCGREVAVLGLAQGHYSIL